MDFKILEVEEMARGRLYRIEVDDTTIQILLTWHSLDRIAIWSLSVEKVLETLLYPEEVLIGHFDRFIAHKRNKNHIFRAVYEYDKKLPVLVTVYYPTADRYFKGGGRFADKIFS